MLYFGVAILLLFKFSKIMCGLLITGYQKQQPPLFIYLFFILRNNLTGLRTQSLK